MLDAEAVAALVRRFYDEVWNRWDDQALAAILVPDFSFRGSLGEQASGPDGFRAYRDRLRAAVPDFRNQVVTLVAAPGSAAVRLHCTGHPPGHAAGPPRDRQALRLRRRGLLHRRRGRPHLGLGAG